MLFRVFEHSPDVINYIIQKEQIKTRIQQNPHAYVKKDTAETINVGIIPPVTDCDVLGLDIVPAREKVPGEVILIEKTDPRQGISISALNFYDNLRSVYEKGYLLIDFDDLKMFFNEKLY